MQQKILRRVCYADRINETVHDCLASQCRLRNAIGRMDQTKSLEGDARTWKLKEYGMHTLQA